MDPVIVEIGIGILTVAIAWGMVKTKVDNLAEEVRTLRSNQRDFVTKDYFEDTIYQIREDFKELKADLKEVIRLLNARG